MNRNIQVALIFLFYAAAAVLSIFLFDGTGDQGDSVHHYLYALYAPQHPELFFDLWAKPVFVIFACPFAQFGFIGMKFFNVLLVMLTLWFTWQTALKMKMANDAAVVIIMVFTPLYYVLTFSGLTEPLFALFVALILYFAVSEKPLTASVIASFIPFVRSEGLIILGVFALYIIYKRQWKYLLLLPAGHLIFMIAGSFVHHDLLWVFSKNPYAKLSSTYGSGRLDHFVVKMLYVTGIPIYILFISGFLKTAWQAVRNKLKSEMFILIFLGFSAYFAAHSVFYYLGIFNSMGLHRVMIGVMPMIAIIALAGLNSLSVDLFKNTFLRKMIVSFFLILIIIFPFVKNRAAINWEKDMKLAYDQVVAQKISRQLISTDSNSRCYVYSYVYLSETLGIDPFDSTRHRNITPGNIDNMKTGDIVIWDNWFAVVENGVTVESIDTLSGFKKLMSENNAKNDAQMFAVYEKK